MTRSDLEPEDDGDAPELVHWFPPRAALGRLGLSADEAKALALTAIGATAVGAVAVGALAIGALAIGRLAVGEARFKRVRIDELVVGRLKVLER